MKVYKIKIIIDSNYFHIEGITKEYMTINYAIHKVKVKNAYVDNPLDNVIYISKNVANKLSIVDSVKYQISIDGDEIIIGPVIGLIVTSQTLKHSKRYFRKYLDRLSNYDNYKGLFVFYSLCNVNLNNDTVYGVYYDRKNDDFIYSKLPLPKYNYRRNFKDDPILVRRLEEHGVVIFNNHKLIKQEFYNYMSRTPLNQHIPSTYNVNHAKCIIELINKHKNIILKPRNLSRGRGIAIIKKIDDEYSVYRYPETKFITYNKQDLTVILSEYNLDNYLVQEYLELNDYKGNIYDIRVVVQLVNGKYKISGIETRVSKNNTITNVSGGASVISYKDSLKNLNKEDLLKVTKRIKEVCIETAEYLNINNNIIELGIDVALTSNLKIYLLEANIYPSFKGFIILNENIFNKIRVNPIKELIRMEGLEINDW